MLLSQWIQDSGISINSNLISGEVDGKSSFKWLVTLTHHRNTMEIEFTQGAGYIHDNHGMTVGFHKLQKTINKQFYRPTPPVLTDVLACLHIDCTSVLDYMVWEDWADNMGYDSDSIKAKKIFKACRKNFWKMCQFLGHDTVKNFLNCENDI